MLLSLVPQDVVESIIDQLSIQGNEATLRQCALVSKSWLSQARKRLFSKIVLQDPSKNPNLCQRLYQVLLANPPILHYIKKLHMHDTMFESFGCQSRDEALPRLLERIADANNLQDLLFVDYRKFHHLPDQLHRAVLKLIRLPTLHTIHLRPWCHCDIPLDCVLTSPYLRHLSLYGGDLIDKAQRHVDPDLPSVVPPPPSSSSPSSQRELESLKIGDTSSHGLVQHLTAPHSTLTISNIRSFAIHDSAPEMFDAAARVIELAGPRIECLLWEYPEYKSGIPKYAAFKFQLLTGLRSLIIFCPNVPNLSKTIHDLIIACGQSKLEHVALIIKYNVYDPSGNALRDIGIEVMAADLDKMLASACNKCALRVRVTVWAIVVKLGNLNIDLDPRGRDVRRLFTQWFPRVTRYAGVVEGGIAEYCNRRDILERLHQEALL